MGKPNIAEWAEILHYARTRAKPIPQLSATLNPFSRSDAYSIQENQLGLRVLAGETQVGWKMGLTSEAKRKQMNLDSPLYGFLTDHMQVPHQGTFFLAGSIHPKIEPEIAFHIAHDLFGVVTRDQILDACDSIAPCLEILDSRYEQFKYFSMEDVIADNSSSSHFVMGPWLKDFRALDLTKLKMEMSINGAVAQKGVSKDISGDPVLSVVQLCGLLAQRDQQLLGGSVVLAGAATAAVELSPGMKISLVVEGLGNVEVGVESRRL